MGIRTTHFFSRLSWVAVLGICLLACSEKKQVIPATVIGPDKMVSILTDVHLAQAAVSSYSVGDTLHFTIGDYMPAIFKNHGTTQQQFSSSLKYYSSNPSLLDSIYKEVLEELSRKEGEADVRAKPDSASK
jgi:hypothetical protein